MVESNSRIEDFKYLGMGLTTEVAEIVDLYKRKWAYKEEIPQASLISEMGDVLWYITFGYHLHRETLPDNLLGILHESAVPDKDQILSKLVHFSSIVFCQSHSYPEEVLEVGCMYDLRQLIQNLWYFCYLNDVDLVDVARANVLKMQKRYPNGFNIQDALNRDVDHEISHIS